MWRTPRGVTQKLKGRSCEKYMEKEAITNVKEEGERSQRCLICKNSLMSTKIASCQQKQGKSDLEVVSLSACCITTGEDALSLSKR